VYPLRPSVRTTRQHPPSGNGSWQDGSRHQRNQRGSDGPSHSGSPRRALTSSRRPGRPRRWNGPPTDPRARRRHDRTALRRHRPRLSRGARDAAFDAMGHVDILVNSPGAVARSSLADVTDEEWEGVFDVQLDGPVTAVQVFADRRSVAPSSTSRRCRHRRRFRTSPPTMTTAKGRDRRVHAGRRRGTRSRDTGQRHPSGVRRHRADGRHLRRGDPRYDTITERTTQSRLAKPEEITGAAVYFASDAASYATGGSSPWTTASVPLPSTPDSVGRSRVSAIAPTGSAITGK